MSELQIFEIDYVFLDRYRQSTYTATVNKYKVQMGNLEHKILMTNAGNHHNLECYSTGSDILIMLNFKCLLSADRYKICS